MPKQDPPKSTLVVIWTPREEDPDRYERFKRSAKKLMDWAGEQRISQEGEKSDAQKKAS